MKAILQVLAGVLCLEVLVDRSTWMVDSSSSTSSLEKNTKNCYCPTPPILILREITICQGDSRTVSCPNGNRMKVYDVFFGRLNNFTCPHVNPELTANTNCKAGWKGVENWKKNCNGALYCYPEASNYDAFFRDVCPQTHKYFKMLYSC